MSYPRLARILYDNPLLIAPGKAEVIEAIFRSYAEGEGIPAAEALERDFAAGIGRSKLFDDGEVKSARAGNGYFLAEGGIAVVPVLGTLVQRGGGMDAFSGIQSYQALSNSLESALADHRARGILLEVDSPGGEAAGLFDFAAQLRDMGAVKPIWAVANEFAYSAAYAIASQTARLSLPASGGVGSIGVMLMHVDKSEADKKRGVKYTPIYAGHHKNDFSSHAPLSPEAMAAAQETVNNLYELFVGAVASGRKIDAQVARDTRAALLSSERAKTLGLADAVEPFRQTLAHFREHLNAPRGSFSSTPKPKGTQMADPTSNAGANNDDARKAELASAQSAAKARIKGILTHAEAGGRTKLAEHLAFGTEMSADEAAAILSASPKDAPPADPKAQNKLDEAMRAAGKKDIPADDGSQAGAKPVPKYMSSAEIFDLRRKQVSAQTGRRS